MEMTIDEALKELKSYNHGFTGCIGNFQKSVDVAIETMRKYQKIEEIYDNWNVDFGVETHRAMSKIGEVLEDGND